MVYRIKLCGRCGSQLDRMVCGKCGSGNVESHRVFTEAEVGYIIRERDHLRRLVTEPIKA